MQKLFQIILIFTAGVLPMQDNTDYVILFQPVLVPKQAIQSLSMMPISQPMQLPQSIPVQPIQQEETPDLLPHHQRTIPKLMKSHEREWPLSSRWSRFTISRNNVAWAMQKFAKSLEQPQCPQITKSQASAFINDYKDKDLSFWPSLYNATPPISDANLMSAWGK